MKAAQFTATKGLEARGLFLWMARATSSLPVPVSPVIRTVAPVGATRAINSRTALHGRARAVDLGGALQANHRVLQEDVLTSQPCALAGA